MQIVKQENNKVFTQDSMELNIENLSILSNKVAQKIINLAKQPITVSQIAKELEVHEQNIYYYIKKLLLSNIIVEAKSEKVHGVYQKYYQINSKAFHILLEPMKPASKITTPQSKFLSPFIHDGKLDAKIIVGSPDPHGPLKARSRDGYFGMDFALWLGTHLNQINPTIMLDTEIHDADLEKHNLIVIGGPYVNRVSAKLEKSMPIYFDEKEKGYYSKISKKVYVNDEIGIISKSKSPFNKEKEVLLITGVRNSGTKSAILAFLKHFDQIEAGNIHNNSSNKIVHGVDLDSDGQIDDVEFLE